MANMSDAAKKLWDRFQFPGRKRKPSSLPTTFSVFDFPPKVRELKDKELVFSAFKWQHAEIAREAVQALTSASTVNEFFYRADVLWNITSPDFYNYILTVATLLRPDTKTFRIPSAPQLQPHQFFPVIHRVPRFRARTDTEHIVITIDETGTDLDPEHLIAYYREDIGANSHHWHWHAVYPWYMEDLERDRKGELFYYMHRQMLARYDSERMSVGLKRVQALDWDEPIQEGYAPHLTTGSGEPYAFRVPGMKLASVVGSASLEDMRNYRARILGAIEAGHFVKPNGDLEPVTIDVLGAVVEHSMESPNMDYYGGPAGIHNFGHDMLANIQDPDGRYKNNNIVFGDETNPNPGGVMGHVQTAIRDPVFYRLHKFVDNLFEEYKRTLTPYTESQLSWSDVRVNSVGITKVPAQTSQTSTNNIETFMKNKTFEIMYGLDFSESETPITVTMPHLDHDEFFYKINVTNLTASEKKATVRIFLTPQLNDGGVTVFMEEYRTLCIELDKFTQTLTPGANSFQRSSVDSSVTIGWDNILGALDGTEGPPICGCGWPHHLLLPRGKSAEEGEMKFSLFVMLTDWEDDKVEGAVRSTTSECEQCKNAASYCGKLNDLYPDRRAMGFPFDRLIVATSLEGFIGQRSNMKATELQITYTGMREDEDK